MTHDRGAPIVAPESQGWPMPIKPLGRARLRLDVAARALNVSEITLEDLARRHMIPGAYYQGELVFIGLDEARAALAELRRESVHRPLLDRGRILA